ncbi:MAG: cytochrome c [Planctomycetes bacterium]|nr:cytochrome c [Planctomycetota bacterium]
MTSGEHGFYARTFFLVAAVVVGLGVLAVYVVDNSPIGMRYVLRTRIVRGKAVTEIPADARAKVEPILTERFGTPAAPKIDLEGWESDGARLLRGAAFYRRNCMHCHGVTGDGDGPTARFLTPRPRDYRLGVFKFTSTVSSAKATREDLLHTVLEGMPGTMMPSFSLYDREDVEAVVDYVIHLSMRGEFEEALAMRLLDGDDLDEDVVEEEVELLVEGWADAASSRQPVPVVQPVPSSAEAIARGSELFRGAGNCISCHGPSGRGDGPSVQGMDPDVWGNPIRPADLTRGDFRGGFRPIDVFRRIHAGVKGTPMPGGSMTEEQMWDLVHYIRSLRRGD